MQKLLILCILTSILLISLVTAATITGDIYIYESGTAKVNLISDIPLNLSGLTFENKKIIGYTEALTKKGSEGWSLMLDVSSYDETFIDIHLPKNMKAVTAIEGDNSFLDLDSRIVTIITPGTVKISYITKPTSTQNWIVYMWILISTLIFAGIIFFVYKIRRKKDRMSDILPFINDNEKSILDKVIKKPMRQKELRDKLGLPKASFSRYITNLEKKRLIIREGDGKNKIIRSS
ncbi:MAG: hypothetical protein Q7S74_00470 [Nanoarchaeota archaeon]|nr:hypothetical protein [Nanoarchaeota archaeon]